MKIKIYDYANEETEITLPDKEIKQIRVEVITGDEIVTIFFKDGTLSTFDSSDARCMDFYDGSYTVEGEQIKKWIDFETDECSTISYDRMYDFLS